MNSKKYFVVVAGGSGSRMGGDLPKQFLHLKGVPILRRTIQTLNAACPDATVITVLPEEYMDYWRNYCIEKEFHIKQILVAGGISRFHSVREALSHVPDGAIVAIHDGVRPLVSVDLVRRMAAMMDNHRAVIPVLPCVDTLKVLERGADGSLTEDEGTILDRSRIFGAQTPQFFRSEDIKAAYRAAYDLRFTDDASVAAAKKIPLSFTEGERYNLKITTAEDMVLAEAILNLRS